MSFTKETDVVRHISKCTVKPQRISEESLQPYYLPPQDLVELSGDYIQTGLLFPKPQNPPIQTILEQLKDSLSTTLSYFYPLAGRLVTLKASNPPSYNVFLECKDSPGVAFVHAVAGNTTVSDILSNEVPPVVEFLFALYRPVNHDSHTLPPLAVQVTELADGIFIGCSFNHVMGDGHSLLNFYRSWSEICRTEKLNVPPVTKRFFLNDEHHIVNLPYSHPDEFIRRYHTSTPHRDRLFHFTSESISHLKKIANSSSFQALAVFVWISVTRARRHSPYQETRCLLLVDERLRVNPPLPPEYFGNFITTELVSTTVGELLSNDLGWSALMLKKAVMDHTDAKIRSVLEEITTNPRLLFLDEFDDHHTVVFTSSPSFDVYRHDFGWGKPITVKTGYGYKFDGKVTMYPGCEGGGSIDVEICLTPEVMSALESDGEFMDAVSRTPTPSLARSGTSA